MKNIKLCVIDDEEVYAAPIITKGDFAIIEAIDGGYEVVHAPSGLSIMPYALQTLEATESFLRCIPEKVIGLPTTTAVGEWWSNFDAQDTQAANEAISMLVYIWLQWKREQIAKGTDKAFGIRLNHHVVSPDELSSN